MKTLQEILDSPQPPLKENGCPDDWSRTLGAVLRMNHDAVIEWQESAAGIYTGQEATR